MHWASIDIDALSLTEDGACTFNFEHFAGSFELHAAGAALVLYIVLAERNVPTELKTRAFMPQSFRIPILGRL